MAKRTAAQEVLEVLSELDDVFAAADEMVGCGDPETFDEKRAALNALHVKVNRLIRAGLGAQ